MPSPKSELDRRNLIASGLAGLGLLGSSTAMSGLMAAPPATKRSKGAGGLHVEGSTPLIPNLAKVMPASGPLMDSLATEFAPLAAKLESQQTYWLAINGWITDRLSGPIMDGTGGMADVGAQAWAVFASSCWGGMELRGNWGMPPLLQSMAAKFPPPFTSVQQTIADKMSQRLAALAGGGEKCLELLPSLFRDNSTTGTLQATAYNAGVQVVLTEDPPIGQRLPQFPLRPSAVRINTRDFMRVDYDLPTPHYLKVWRSNFEKAVTANPAAYEKVIVGAPGEMNLREIWKGGVLLGNKTWGGDIIRKWSPGYFNDSLRYSSTLNFGLEAVSLAAFVAVINQDPEAAKRAVMGNALYVGATAGWLIGMLDVGRKLPTVSAA